MFADTQIIFSDIDGTFLADDHRVGERTLAAVREVLRQGKRFVLVSARMPEAIYPIIDEIELSIPLISGGGSLILDEEGNTIFDRRLKAERVGKILRHIEKEYPAATVNYYAGLHWYVSDSKDPFVRKEAAITGAKPESADFISLLERGVLPNKLLVMADEALCRQMEKELGHAFIEFHIVRSSTWLVEIMDKEISKAKGIAVLLRHYGLESGQALAFGDNYNDLDMFRLIKNSVAMGNAPDDVKREAAFVTASNNEEGIWQFLREKCVPREI